MSRRDEKLDDEFYVGYVPTMPPRMAARLARVCAGVALVVILGAAVVLLSHRRLETSQFDYGRPRRVGGVLERRPYPSLQLDGQRTWLVSPGKAGADALLADVPDGPATLQGSLIARGRQTMLEVVPGSVASAGGNTVAREPGRARWPRGDAARRNRRQQVLPGCHESWRKHRAPRLRAPVPAWRHPPDAARAGPDGGGSADRARDRVRATDRRPTGRDRRPASPGAGPRCAGWRHARALRGQSAVSVCSLRQLENDDRRRRRLVLSTVPLRHEIRPGAEQQLAAGHHVHAVVACGRHPSQQPPGLAFHLEQPSR